jgi:hypothetical protein
MARAFQWLSACIVAGFIILSAVPAQGVIVDGANGTGAANVLPGSPPPLNDWDNAGSILGASGVYLGNQWGLTAAHIAANGIINPGTVFTLTDGRSFTVDQVSTRVLNGDSSPADLILFHLATNPGLPSVTLASSSPALGTQIFSMGNGLTRSSNVQFYNRTGTGPFVWTPLPNSTGANASGYTESSPNVYRWGTNVTTGPFGGGTPTTVVNAGSGNTTIFASTFDQGGTSSESQVSAGDSGGPVFSSGNVLIGINNYAIPLDNDQPANTAIFGNQSGYANIATYRSQIVSVTGVPEPASLGVMGIVMSGLLLRRARW